MYVAPDRPFYVEEQECEWSVELEALRLFAATSCMVATFHLLEMFKLDHDTGVLIIIARRMVEDLVVWLKPVLFVMLAFAFAFHLLSPNYRNADTLENHAPPFRPIPGLSLDFSSSGTPTATQPQGVNPTSTPPSAPTPTPKSGTSQRPMSWLNACCITEHVLHCLRTRHGPATDLLVECICRTYASHWTRPSQRSPG